MIEFRKLVPILTVRDLDAEVAFYRTLGLTIHYQGDDIPDFVALRGGDVLFGLERRDDFSADEANRALLWQFEIDDLAIAARVCRREGYRYTEPYCIWAAGDDWAMETWSPNGYKIRFEGPCPPNIAAGETGI